MSGFRLMTQHAQIAERKYSRPHARPFHLRFARVAAVLPLIWRARGNARRSSGWSRNSISTRIGQFSAGPATSPSPCFHLPSFTLDGQRIEQIDYVRLLLVDDFHFVLQPI